MELSNTPLQYISLVAVSHLCHLCWLMFCQVVKPTDYFISYISYLFIDWDICLEGKVDRVKMSWGQNKCRIACNLIYLYIIMLEHAFSIDQSPCSY